jgi:hypothetical protein
MLSFKQLRAAGKAMYRISIILPILNKMNPAQALNPC